MSIEHLHNVNGLEGPTTGSKISHPQINRTTGTKPMLICDHKRPEIFMQTAMNNFHLGRFTDVTFLVENRKFHAHRLVLVSLSDYFAPLFQMDEKGSGEVVLQNISPDDFEILLNYAYTGQVDITPENVQSVFIAADYFNIAYVKKECIKYIESHIDIDNVCDALLFGISYSFIELECIALEFIKKNLDCVSQSERFSALDPDYLFKLLDDDSLVLFDNNIFLRRLERENLIFKSVLRYLSSSKSQNPYVFQLLLSSVRLPEITNDCIKKCLKGFKDINRNEILKKFLKLREVAVKCIDKRKHNNSLLTELAAKSKEVPESWFRPRKLSSFSIVKSETRYAAGGEVALCFHPPLSSLNDPCLEIQSIELWVRRWDDRPVIGGLKIVHRKTNSLGRSSEYFKGSQNNSVMHHKVELQPNEMITKVVIGSGWLIDRLGFETNLGHVFGPYGGPGGSHYEEKAPSATFSYLYDICCDSTRTQDSDAIFNLMFRWIEFR